MRRGLGEAELCDGHCRFVRVVCCRGGVSGGGRDDRLRTVAESTMQPLASTTAVGADGDGGRTVEIGDETTIQL